MPCSWNRACLPKRFASRLGPGRHFVGKGKALTHEDLSTIQNGVGLSKIFVGRAKIEPIERKLQSIKGPKLVTDLTEIVFDYLVAGTDLNGNLLVAHALRDVVDDSQLIGVISAANFAGGLAHPSGIVKPRSPD